MHNRRAVKELDRDLLGEGYLSDEPYRMVESLTEMGSRFAGSDSERQATDYLENRMRDYSLSRVSPEEFSYTGWKRGEASLTALTREPEQYEVISLAHTGTFTAEGDLLYLGLGTPARWEANADRLSGKIVLVDAKSPHWIRGGIHRLEKFGRAVQAGARGFIWMRDQGGYLHETGGLRPDAEIPGVAISREDGLELVRRSEQADEPLRVRIRTENTVGSTTSRNVVGEIPGNQLSDQVIIIGAHFDGHDIAPGAMDDAAGAAVAMEAGRLLARCAGSLARTVRIVCFAAEEIGLLGSRAYVRDHSEDLDCFNFMLNLDGAGRGGEMGILLQDWPELLPVFEQVSQDMKWPFTTDVGLAMSSDMYPFSFFGVPSGRLADFSEVSTSRNWGHTVADTLDKVSPSDLRKDSTLVARIALRLANWPDWPALSRDTDDIIERIHRTGMGEAFRFSHKDLR